MGKGAEAGGPITIGYHYYLSMHLAVCHGPVDYVKDIRTGENTIIYGGKSSEAADLKPKFGPDIPTAVAIMKPSLYGGAKKEGGIGTSTAKNSSIYFLWGGANQQPLARLKDLINGTYDSDPITSFDSTGNATTYSITQSISLESENIDNEVIQFFANQTSKVAETTAAITDEIPAFRGVLSCIWDDLHYQTNSSRPKPWNFKVCRIPMRGYLVDGKDVSVITQQVEMNNNYIVSMGGVGGNVQKKGTDLLIDGVKIDPMNAYNTTGSSWHPDQPLGWSGRGALLYFKLSNVVFSRGDILRVGDWQNMPGSILDPKKTTTEAYADTDWKFYMLVDTLVDGTNQKAWTDSGWTKTYCDIIAHFTEKPDGQIYPTQDSNAALAAEGSAKADALTTIEEANPALILWEIITNNTWGMGFSPDMVDEPSFNACALTLFNENFGLSAVWENESTIEDFISVILTTINAVLYVSPRSGKFMLKLIREVPNTVDVKLANESNIIEMRSYSRIATAELTNQVTVNWTDPILGTNNSATIHNTAVREMQGYTVAVTRTYPAVTSQVTALKIANRDLAIMSQPLAQVELVVNREFSETDIGDVIDWHWDDLGVDKLRLRVIQIGYGLLEDGRITLKCIEDVFSVNTAHFVPMTNSEWGAKKVTPLPEKPVDFELINLNRVDLIRLQANRGRTTQFDLVDISNSAIAVLAAPAHEEFEQFDFEARYSISGKLAIQNAATNLPDIHENSPYYFPMGVFDFVPYARLTNDLDRTQTTFAIGSSLNLNLVRKDSYLYCDNEFMQVISAAPDFSTITVKRGIISTAPKRHAANSILYFYSDSLDKVTIDKEWVDGQWVAGTPLTWSGNTLLDVIPAAQSKSVAVKPDWVNPYPPANVRADFVNEIQVKIEWDHRDADLLQDKIMGQSDGKQARTAGTYYAIRIINGSGVTILDMPRWVGHKLPNGFFETSYLWTITDFSVATQIHHIGIKTVKGGLASEWNWTTININNPTSQPVGLDNAEIFGEYDPVHVGIADEIEVTLTGDFAFDAMQSRFEFVGDTLNLSFETNFDELMTNSKPLFTKEEQDNWFSHFDVVIYDLENATTIVDEFGVSHVAYAVLSTKSTKESKYSYSLHENTLDHVTGPSTAIGIGIFLVDTAGNSSRSHTKVKTKTGDVFNALPVTTLVSSTGLSVPGAAPREGIVAQILPKDSSLTGVSKVGVITQFVIRNEDPYPVNNYRYYGFDKTGALVTEATKALYADFTGLEVLSPSDFSLWSFDTTQNKFIGVTR